MKRILIVVFAVILVFALSACGQANVETEDTNNEELTQQEVIGMQIRVIANGNTIVYELNDSRASQEFYEQLPLNVEVNNYSHNEKIFYPQHALDVSDAPEASGGNTTLAYYAPWGDVVMFYDDYQSAGGLYALGEVVSGSEYIAGISGTVQIEAVN